MWYLGDKQILFKLKFAVLVTVNTFLLEHKNLGDLKAEVAFYSLTDYYNQYSN